jgi:hypothetical protein
MPGRVSNLAVKDWACATCTGSRARCLQLKNLTAGLLEQHQLEPHSSVRLHRRLLKINYPDVPKSEAWQTLPMRAPSLPSAPVPAARVLPLLCLLLLRTTSTGVSSPNHLKFHRSRDMHSAQVLQRMPGRLLSHAPPSAPRSEVSSASTERMACSRTACQSPRAVAVLSPATLSTRPNYLNLRKPGQV